MSTNVVENAAKRAKNFSNEVLKIKRMSENAFIPKRGSPLSAGYDLCSAYEVVIPARGKGLVKTEQKVEGMFDWTPSVTNSIQRGSNLAASRSKSVS